MEAAIVAAVGSLAGGGLVLATSSSCTVCPGGNAGETREDFEIASAFFSESEFDGFFGVDDPGASGDGSYGDTPWAEVSEADQCKFACRYAMDRTADGHGFEDVALDACSVTESDDPDAVAPYEIACEGTRTRVEYCEGRRPLDWRAHRRVASQSNKAWIDDAAAHEHASVTAFRELAAALAHHGFAPELVTRALAAADDEVEHTRLLIELGARDPRGHDIAATRPPGLEALATHNAVAGCVEEGWAAVRVRWRAMTAASPEHRRVFARIAADEAGHAALAWELHRAFMLRLEPAAAVRVRTVLERSLAALQATPPRDVSTPGPAASAADWRGAARSFAQSLLGTPLEDRSQ